MKKSTVDKETNLKSLYILLTIIFIVWLISLFFLYNLKNRGTFGDMFGGINALFSGFAFAGVIFAIFLQKNELELQRKELEYTREELKGQKEQLEAQNITLQKQNFESSFFQLLRTHTEIVNSIDLVKKTTTQTVGGPNPTGQITNIQTTTGRDCFHVFYNRYKRRYKKCRENHPNWEEKKVIEKSYKEFYETIQSDTGHYFLYLYNIVKYIRNAGIGNKDFYSNLVRAQLSYDELSLLFYNCLSIPPNNKFKPMIEDFSLFKNLPISLLIDGETHPNLYANEAFGKPTKTG